MKKKSIRDTPVIVIPKGYTVDEMLDFDDEGYENVIFCWVMDRREIVEAVLAPLAGREFQLFHFSLVCAPGTLEERLRRDVEAGLRAPDVIGRSLERLPLYDLLGGEKIGTDGLSAAEAAREIARRTGQG